MYKLRKLSGFSKKDLAYLILFLADYLEQSGTRFAEDPILKYLSTHYKTNADSLEEGVSALIKFLNENKLPSKS